MKKTSKTLLSFLLAFGMILSMFAVTSATSWAADEHVPASATLVAYPKPATESLASLSSKVSGLKSSNKAVVTAKLSKSTYGTSQTYYTMELQHWGLTIENNRKDNNLHIKEL